MTESAVDAFRQRATALLVRIASESDDRLAHAYDELLFDFLLGVVKRRGASLAIGVGEQPIWLPSVQPADLDAVAINVTVAALERARRTAARFDPARGDGASWALGAARHAYVDVVRDFYDVRRRSRPVTVDPGDLADLSDSRHHAASPEAIVETRAALEDALRRLEPEERFVVLAQAQYGMSYAEIASYLLGSPEATKRIDYLLQRARQKLALAEQAWNGGAE